jgi:hypothetical protein
VPRSLLVLLLRRPSVGLPLAPASVALLLGPASVVLLLGSASVALLRALASVVLLLAQASVVRLALASVFRLVLHALAPADPQPTSLAALRAIATEVLVTDVMATAGPAIATAALQPMPTAPLQAMPTALVAPIPPTAAITPTGDTPTGAFWSVPEAEGGWHLTAPGFSSNRGAPPDRRSISSVSRFQRSHHIAARSGANVGNKGTLAPES